MVVRSATKTDPKLNVEVFRQANSRTNTLFSPVAIASDGERLFVNSRFMFYRSDDNGRLENVLTGEHTNSWTSGLIVTSEALYAFGQDGIIRSADAGASFKPVLEPSSVRAMAAEPNGTLWAGDEDGVILVKLRGAKSFTAIDQRTAGVTAMCQSTLGVFIGDEEGRLWIGRTGKLSATSLQTGEPIRAVLETDRGTILAISGGEHNQKPTLARSTNGGKSFKTTPFKGSLLVLAQIPDGGPIIAGGWEGLLAVSRDDGSTFERV
ncbi:MAG TPA: WD40 repeat domain-containing protein, partial [Kofleriaceae bacterium]|nr:WD40 repeat domain-containing protein [Kofleriaceae bacterium]